MNIPPINQHFDDDAGLPDDPTPVTAPIIGRQGPFPPKPGRPYHPGSHPVSPVTAPIGAGYYHPQQPQVVLVQQPPKKRFLRYALVTLAVGLVVCLGGGSLAALLGITWAGNKLSSVSAPELPELSPDGPLLQPEDGHSNGHSQPTAPSAPSGTRSQSTASPSPSVVNIEVPNGILNSDDAVLNYITGCEIRTVPLPYKTALRCKSASPPKSANWGAGAAISLPGTTGLDAMEFRVSGKLVYLHYNTASGKFVSRSKPSIQGVPSYAVLELGDIAPGTDKAQVEAIWFPVAVS